jgi:hypothetical protein
VKCFVAWVNVAANVVTFPSPMAVGLRDALECLSGLGKNVHRYSALKLAAIIQCGQNRFPSFASNVGSAQSISQQRS